MKYAKRDGVTDVSLVTEQIPGKKKGEARGSTATKRGGLVLLIIFMFSPKRGESRVASKKKEKEGGCAPRLSPSNIFQGAGWGKKEEKGRGTP